jgi:hypothetical protein
MSLLTRDVAGAVALADLAWVFFGERPAARAAVGPVKAQAQRSQTPDFRSLLVDVLFRGGLQ